MRTLTQRHGNYRTQAPIMHKKFHPKLLNHVERTFSDPVFLFLVHKKIWIGSMAVNSMIYFSTNLGPTYAYATSFPFCHYLPEIRFYQRTFSDPVFSTRKTPTPDISDLIWVKL